MHIYQHLQLFDGIMSAMGNVTISQAEYDEFLAQKHQMNEMQTQLDWLLEQLRLARHKQFGSSSERSRDKDDRQLSFFNEAEAYADPTVVEPTILTIQSYRRKQKTALKDRLPKDLPVEVIDYTLADLQCPDCHSTYDDIGVEERETIKIIPATVSLLRERAHRYVCRCCEALTDKAIVVEAPMPAAVLPKSIASAETIAHVMTQKFALHVPLYRQEQDWKSRSIPISRQTMSNWVIESSRRYFKPLIDVMHQQLCEEPVLHADETSLQVLHEPGKAPESMSYMWLYRTGKHSLHPLVLYEYQPSRSAGHPKAFLKNFTGYLHVDGYGGYKTLLKTKEQLAAGEIDRIMLAGCWSHARRKFDEALKAQLPKHRKQSLAYEAIKRCDALFGIEGKANSLTVEARYQIRQEQSTQLLDEFFDWLRSIGPTGKTKLGVAINYCLKQEKWLRTFLEDGRIELSNNLAERSIKPFVMSRKNFMFANTPNGAKASAWVFSLIETAKANDIIPFDYLTWILKKAPTLNLDKYPEQASDLLPKNYPR